MKCDDVAQRLAEKIRLEKWPGSGVLPSVRDMASLFEVSVPTMLRALEMLKERKVLDPTPRGTRYRLWGYYQSRAAAKLSPATRRHERIAADLKGRVLAGEFDAQRHLPHLKELQKGYACTHGTMRDALAVLCERYGLVKEEGRGYVLRGPSAAPRSGTAVYLCGGADVKHSYRFHFFTVMATLEREIQRLGWGPMRYYLAPEPDLRTAPPDHLVSAFVHVEHASSKNWGNFFRARPRIPLIRIDFEEIVRGRFPDHKTFRRIMPSNVHAGREVARRLWSLGHRRIAFLCHLRDKSLRWVQYRREGLAEFFPEGSAGRGPCMVSYSLGEPESPPGRRDRPRGPGEAGLAWVYRRLRTSSIFAPGYIRFKLKGAFDLLQAHELGDLMAPLFAEALEDRRITAWVCANDLLAILAVNYLRSRGVRVPGRVSVIGFDNTPESFDADLTSYDFGVEKMGCLAARALETPGAVDADAQGNVRVTGQLVVRGSLGARKKPGAEPMGG